MFDINKGTKLKSLHINKHKVLNDFDIDFTNNDNEPLPIIVLAGINGTGKTTILNSIYEPKDFVNNGIFHDLQPNCFNSNEEINKGIKITVFKDNIEKIFDTTLSQINLSELIIWSIDAIECIRHSNDSMLKKIENFIPIYIDHLIYEEDILASKAYEKVRDHIKNSLENLDIDITFDSLNSHKKVFLKNKSGSKFTFDELSTGEKILFSKVLTLYFSNFQDGLILIDEPELSLHPEWQNNILKIYENYALENNCQIIIATHSANIIASTKAEYLRLLVKDNNKIVVKKVTKTPLDRDVNTIMKTIMGANYFPKHLEELHEQYIKFVDDNNDNCKEARTLKNKILEYESENSSFFQNIAFKKALES